MTASKKRVDAWWKQAKRSLLLFSVIDKKKFRLNSQILCLSNKENLPGSTCMQSFIIAEYISGAGFKITESQILQSTLWFVLGAFLNYVICLLSMDIHVNVPRTYSDLHLHNLSVLVDYLDALKYIHQSVQSCHLAKCDTEVHLAAE